MSAVKLALQRRPILSIQISNFLIKFPIQVYSGDFLKRQVPVLFLENIVRYWDFSDYFESLGLENFALKNKSLSLSQKYWYRKSFGKNSQPGSPKCWSKKVSILASMKSLVSSLSEHHLFSATYNKILINRNMFIRDQFWKNIQTLLLWLGKQRGKNKSLREMCLQGEKSPGLTVLSEFAFTTSNIKQSLVSLGSERLILYRPGLLISSSLFSYVLLNGVCVK